MDADAGSRVLELAVKDQSGGEVRFKVKPTTAMGKVFDAFCQKKSLEPATVRFLFDGMRVAATSTPRDLGMEDGDSIDCVVEQVGGM